MSRKKKTPMEIAKGVYVNKSEIARLLGVAHVQGAKIFDQVQKIEIAELNDNYIDRTKVRTASLLKVLGLTREDIINQASTAK